MPIMSRYTRLRDSHLANELDLFEKADVGTHYFLENEAGAELEAGPGDLGQKRMEHECFQSKVLSSSSLQQQQHTQVHSQQTTKGSSIGERHCQNIENGNPNVVASFPLTHASAPAQSNGASKLRERVGGGSSRELGLSSSARWVGKCTGERSSKWRGVMGKSFRREEASAPVKTPPGESWACFTQRVSSHRQPMLNRQVTQELAAGGSDISFLELRSQCDDVQLPQPRTKTGSTPLVEQKRGTEMAVLGRSVSDGRSLREGSSAMQRSFSTTEVRIEIAPEEWGPRYPSPPASPSHSQLRAAAAARERRHHVSFSLTENVLEDFEQPPRQEKWRKPTSVTHGKVLAAAKNNPDHLPYNYEQPGFVEREKDATTGIAYTIYKVNGLKDCSKGSSNPSCQLPLVRAFSMREKSSRYSRIARSFSFSAGKHAVPVQCMACGSGMGNVEPGFPSPKDSSVCKSCESRPGQKQADKKKPSKERSILNYCRKLLGLSKSGR